MLALWRGTRPSKPPLQDLPAKVLLPRISLTSNYTALVQGVPAAQLRTLALKAGGPDVIVRKCTESEEFVRLVNDLRTMGIAPFLPEEVKAYKEKMAKRTPAEAKKGINKSWKLATLADYDDMRIPSYVLETAGRIQEAIRKGDLQGGLVVDHLESQVAYDPFLAVYRRTTYSSHMIAHVEVWDEPGFDAKRVW